MIHKMGPKISKSTTGDYMDWPIKLTLENCKCMTCLAISVRAAVKSG